jgi:hypothetical protein
LPSITPLLPTRSFYHPPPPTLFPNHPLCSCLVRNVQANFIQLTKLLAPVNSIPSKACFSLSGQNLLSALSACTKLKMLDAQYVNITEEELRDLRAQSPLLNNFLYSIPRD